MPAAPIGIAENENAKDEVECGMGDLFYMRIPRLLGNSGTGKSAKT
jgi:hypothetical protein